MPVRQREGEFRLLWPEFGGLSILVSLPLVYLLVVIATPSLADQLRPLYPAWFPEPFTTVVAVLLWAGTALVVLYLAAVDVLVSVRRFDTRRELEAHLTGWHPDRRWYALAVGRTAVGGTLVVVGWRPFVGAFERLIEMTVIVLGDFEPLLTATNVGWLVGFLAGFVLFAGGVDRLLVSGARAALRRRYAEG